MEDREDKTYRGKEREMNRCVERWRIERMRNRKREESKKRKGGAGVILIHTGVGFMPMKEEMTVKSFPRVFILNNYERIKCRRDETTGAVHTTLH